MGDTLGRWADPPLLVLASLADEPKHGYAITQDVADTMGVRLSAGTLYAVICHSRCCRHEDAPAAGSSWSISLHSRRRSACAHGADA